MDRPSSNLFDHSFLTPLLFSLTKRGLTAHLQTVVLDAIVQEQMDAFEDRGLSVVDFARKLEGVNVNQVRNDLGAMHYLFRKNGNWAVYAKFRDTLLSEKAALDGSTVIVALEQGQQLLAKLYHDGRLTMKAGCKPNRKLSLEAVA